MLRNHATGEVHPTEVIKWGIFDGFWVGLFIAILAVLHARQEEIVGLAGGWEYAASFLLITLVSIGAIIVTTVALAHPLYSFMRGNYRDALLTIVVSLLTVLSMTVFVIWSSPWLAPY